MDRHLFEAFIESLTEAVADKVVQRLALRPLAKTAVQQLPAETAMAVNGEPPDTAKNGAEYLTTREAAELLGVTVKGLAGMRAAGRGPKFIRIGGRIRYRRSDLT